VRERRQKRSTAIVDHVRAFKFPISRQDIEEGQLIFDIEHPYRLAKNEEG
jgi:hypothetical protein